jgi:uncharacterized SAM-binding protein YcdF (DUF218 family)
MLLVCGGRPAGWALYTARVRIVLIAVLAIAVAVTSASFALGAVARAPVDLLVARHGDAHHVDAVAIHGGGGASGDRELPAVALWREGRTARLVALGGALPLGDPDVTYARAVARRLAAMGVPAEAVRLLEVGSSTSEEMLALREVAEAEGWRSIALSTSRWHSRRAAIIADQVFGGSAIAWTIVVPDELDFPADRWWQERRSRELVYGEWAKVGLALAFPTFPE